MAELINLTKNELIGTVTYIDTQQVMIELNTGRETINRIGVGNLVAIETSKQHVIIISLVDNVVRKYIEDFGTEDDDSDDSIVLSSYDYIKVSIIGTYYSVFGSKRNLFKRGVESFPQIDGKSYVLDGSNLQNFMNSLSKNIKSSKLLKIGKFIMDRNADAILDGNKLFQRHAAVLGSTGSGKSWCVAKILEKVAELKNPNVIVFDMHGEYSALTQGSNPIAQSYKIAGPADLCTTDDSVLFLPYWLLNREELLSMILDRSDQNAPNQASRFTFHIRNLKAETLKNEGKDDVEKSFTVDSPIPFEINELIEKLRKDDTTKGEGKGGRAIKGDWEGKLTRFISRLETKISDKRYGFMFQPSANTLSYDWLGKMLMSIIGHKDGAKGIKIIDFSEVPSDVLPVVTGTLARLLYDVQFWMESEKRTPFTIVCDEAHLYLPIRENADTVQQQALYNFERIAKEGRKYGVSLMAVSQRPSDISKTILSQCNNFIVLRLTNETDKSVVKNLLPDALRGSIEMLPLLDVGEAFVVGDAILLPSRILLDEPEEDHRPFSATRNFWDEWDSDVASDSSIQEAVEALRRQSRT